MKLRERLLCWFILKREGKKVFNEILEYGKKHDTGDKEIKTLLDAMEAYKKLKKF